VRMLLYPSPPPQKIQLEQNSPNTILCKQLSLSRVRMQAVLPIHFSIQLSFSRVYMLPCQQVRLKQLNSTINPHITLEQISLNTIPTRYYLVSSSPSPGCARCSACRRVSKARTLAAAAWNWTSCCLRVGSFSASAASSAVRA